MASTSLPYSESTDIRAGVGWIVAVLFVWGLYSPTSIGSVFSTLLWAVSFCLLLVLLLLLLLRKHGMGSTYLLGNSLLILAILFAATIRSPFPDYRWGGLLPFIPLVLLLSVNLRELAFHGALRSWLTVVNAINITAGIAVIVHADRIGDFIIDFYSFGYTELVPTMVKNGLPVMTFGTHSVAAFFYYLFFWINFETFKTHKTWFNFVSAICYIGLGCLVRSVTGVGLMLVAILQLLHYGAQKNLRRTLLGIVLAGMVALGVLYYYVPYTEDWVAGAKVASDIVTSPTGGFLGRFSQTGTLYATVNYIRNNPFSPVGFGNRDDLMFGDSGPVEYLLRGSIVLVYMIYGGLFLFLRQNMLSRRYAWNLFLVIMAFETGYSSLGYYRILYFIPVLVVYLNDLTRVNQELVRTPVLA